MALLVGVLLCVAAFALARGGDGREDGGIREVAGVRHSGGVGVPREAPRGGGDARVMVASYYGYSLEGERTASGEPFDPEGYTAAHKSLPLGTELRVSRGGESVRVVVNDRGPYEAGRDLDLSLAAAREIGLIGPGAAPVRVVVP